MMPWTIKNLCSKKRKRTHPSSKQSLRKWTGGNEGGNADRNIG
jgi:hypothetical protein